MRQLLIRFIRSFQKAIAEEMDAMRRRMGPFELLLASPRQVEAIESSDGRHFFYVFQIVTQSNKLALNTECTLRIDNSETLVTTTNLDRNRVTIRSAIEIPLEAADYMLIIYPWFLYQRLQTALESLLEEDSYCVDTALRLFGKIPPDRQPTSLQLPHAELNARQREAVQLCSDRNLAFIWGPPGTGKTTTLGHILTELMKQEKRLLVTSTTNAAIDQALAHLAELGDAQPTLMSGRIVRVGQTEAPTFGASTNEVKNRLHAETREKIEALRSLQNERYGQITPCDLILEKLQADTQQLDLFDRVELKTLTSQDLRPIFSENYLQYVLNLPTKRQKEVVLGRKGRLEKVCLLCQQEIDRLGIELNRQEMVVVRQAQVILSTMANVYLSPLLNRERFDVVVVEEAAMAVLPALFYCAALAQTKIIMVGDKRQLPPIIQSNSEYVNQAMGRNIFEATEGTANNMVVMLEVQYRMHPVIGEMVSQLFYHGRLKHGKNAKERRTISDRRPFPGEQVQCRTVHRFQGNERDLVIFDTVDTAPMSPGILLAGDSPRSNAPNLLNVSLSRARGKLIIVA